jgi:hypothetical protein
MPPALKKSLRVSALFGLLPFAKTGSSRFQED